MSGLPLRPRPGTGEAGSPDEGGSPWRPGLWGEEEEPSFGKVVVFGGVYSNHHALQSLLETVDRDAGVDALVCLGDLGAFGPHPDRSIALIREAGIPVVRGNYDDSIARGLEDCQCGYTDPRDNHFARISYEYTLSHTSDESRQWMRGFPGSLRFTVGGLRVLAFHGSPRRMNEFLWETATPTHFLSGLADAFDADLLIGTHTGLHWTRDLGDGRAYVNVGAVGRPANDGRPVGWYTVLEDVGGRVERTFHPLPYDHEALAREMEEEGLPGEFIETIRTGWWTTCLEVLPGKERARGRW